MSLAFFFLCKFKGLDKTCKIFNFHGMWFITKFLPNMRKQNIKTMPSEVFCLWLLTWKQQLVHPFFISVIVIFSQVFGSIDWGDNSGHVAHLIFLSVIFRDDMSLYDISCFLTLTWSVGGRRPIIGAFEIKRRHRVGPASMCFVPNYLSSVSKTLQSWCRALKVFHQTSLLPLCNVFYHVYERSLKLLEIDNISSVSKHELKISDKFFHFHLQMDVYW